MLFFVDVVVAVDLFSFVSFFSITLFRDILCLCHCYVLLHLIRVRVRVFSKLLLLFSFSYQQSSHLSLL